ncbi:MAG: aldehyde dehydrogenase family protein [Ahrensia sp.]|nr:aldehyde dehydrogenase family protein [Ahrensia sp.]
MMIASRKIGDASIGVLIENLVARARTAQKAFEANGSQQRYDDAALAAAWAVMEPTRNTELSTMAVETTGLGNVADKMTKNHRKTLGLLRDIRHAKTHGVIENDLATGITKIARPVGVVGAIVPSTNPVATPVNNIVNALKCGNAIIIAPSPKGAAVCERLIGYIHAEFDKIGIDRALVQMIPQPVAKAKAQLLMERVDLLVATGSQDNVRRAATCGTPAIGVGAGNVSVIVDETANLAEAAAKIAASKRFDNSTSCSSENAIILIDAIADQFLAHLDRAGGRLVEGTDAWQLISVLFGTGQINRAMLAKDIDQVIAAAQIRVERAETAAFLIVEGRGIGPHYPESGEKLSLATTLYRARDFDHAAKLAGEIFDHLGAGHSVGLHSRDEQRPLQLGMTLPTCRVIVNQPHSFATGGAFDNGLPFSLSMGCGSWGGNIIDDNLNYRHFMNVTKIVRPIAENRPDQNEIFEHYWKKAGR